MTHSQPYQTDGRTYLGSRKSMPRLQRQDCKEICFASLKKQSHEEMRFMRAASIERNGADLVWSIPCTTALFKATEPMMHKRFFCDSTFDGAEKVLKKILSPAKHILKQVWDDKIDAVNAARHELAEAIRKLSRGTGLKSERLRKLESSKLIEIRHERKHTAYLLLAPEHQGLRIITFHQPVVAHISEKKDRGNHPKAISYRIPRIVTKREEKLEVIPEVTTSNKRKMKVKRKRKRFTTFSRIEELLSKGKDILLLPDPSEESIPVNVEEEIEVTHERNITHLPEDLLKNIFWFFSLRERCTILSRVCKTWYYILKDPVFWKKLEFEGDRVPTNTITDLISRCSLLNTLKLTSVPRASHILQELCRDKIELKELAVRYCVLDKIDCIFVLVQLVHCLPNLHVLDLEGTEFHSNRFFTELCLMRNLRSLNLGANRFLHPRDLMTISLNCRRLETLKILDIPWDSASNEKFTDENFSFILKNLQNSITHLEHDMQKLGNSAYLAILQCKKLRTLHLTNCLLLTGEMFRRFNQLEQLKELNLTLAINLSPDDFEALFSGGKLKEMERLSVSGCWRVNKSNVAWIQSLLLPLDVVHAKIMAGDIPVTAVFARKSSSRTVGKDVYESKLKIKKNRTYFQNKFD